MTGMKYGLALVVVCLVLLAAGAGLGWLVEARIAGQVTELRERGPEAWARLHSYLEGRAWGQWAMDTAAAQWNAIRARTAVSAGVGMLTATGEVLAEILIVLFIGLFGAINPRLYTRGAMHLIPPKHRDRGRAVLEASGETLWWWVVGQLVSMAFIGLVTWITLWALGVPLAATLGILAGLLNFVPNFGPLLAAGPAMLLALLSPHGPITAVWVAVAYSAIQLLQNHIVTPVVQQKAVRLPAVVLMFAQVFMYYWAGVLGMALAPALAAVVMRVVQILYVRDTLDDPMRDGDSFWLGARKPGTTDTE